MTPYELQAKKKPAVSLGIATGYGHQNAEGQNLFSQLVFYLNSNGY